MGSLDKYYRCRRMFNVDFIGAEEINAVNNFFNIEPILPEDLPEIPYSEDVLNKALDRNAILFILPHVHKNRIPITINSIKDIVGINESKFGVCFYNQDWYINEHFANFNFGYYKWCLVEKDVNTKSLALTNQELVEKLNYQLPYAIELVFLFFAYYILKKEILWANNFIWCSDKDANNDPIYVARYFDPLKIARNGFSIHRHLTITNIYGGINSYK